MEAWKANASAPGLDSSRPAHNRPGFSDVVHFIGLVYPFFVKLSIKCLTYLEKKVIL
jgi:hypothetical protein